jgi:hypothetical protein
MPDSADVSQVAGLDAYARYDAELARRRYINVDPANRLVTDTGHRTSCIDSPWDVVHGIPATVKIE